MQAIDIETAIQRCHELVDNDSQISLDVITLSDSGQEIISGKTAPDKEGWQQISEAMLKHPEVNYRYLIAASAKTFKNFDMLNFDYVNTQPVYEQGIQDAIEIVQENPGERFIKLK